MPITLSFGLIAAGPTILPQSSKKIIIGPLDGGTRVPPNISVAQDQPLSELIEQGQVRESHCGLGVNVQLSSAMTMIKHT